MPRRSMLDLLYLALGLGGFLAFLALLRALDRS